MKTPRASWRVSSRQAVGIYIPLTAHTSRFRAGMDRVRCGMRCLFIMSPDRGTEQVLGVGVVCVAAR